MIVGGILGHMACTGLAVLMGRFVAQRIPVKWRKSNRCEFVVYYLLIAIIELILEYEKPELFNSKSTTLWIALLLSVETDNVF